MIQTLYYYKIFNRFHYSNHHTLTNYQPVNHKIIAGFLFYLEERL